MSAMRVKVRIFIEEDGDRLHAYSPDLKGLHVDGANIEEVTAAAKDAVDAYITSLIRHNDPLPIGVMEDAPSRRQRARTLRRGAVKNPRYIETDVPLPLAM